MKKADRGEEPHGAARGPSAAFLLAQVGAHAAQKFGERLSGLNLAPAHAGILRILGRTPAITQQALADALGMVASRLVALIDELEERGLAERRENAEDRRRYALHLTAQGRSTLEAIGRVAREHQQALLKSLSNDEQQLLALLLERVAADQGLVRGVHPGYARSGMPPEGRENP
jgi:DNA-binding MarR family transcriptional regulator